MASEYKFDNEKNYKPMNYDSYIVLPLLKGVLLRISDGIVDKKTLNKTIVLYRACPSEIQERISVSDVFGKSLKKLENGSDLEDVKKKAVYDLIFTIKDELEDLGLLRDSRSVRSGKV